MKSINRPHKLLLLTIHGSL